MTLDLLLAQGIDLIEIGKAVGSLSATALLGIAAIILWWRRESDRVEHEAKREADRIAAEAKREADRVDAERRIQAAQAKLDDYQEARIRELERMYSAAIGGGK